MRTLSERLKAHITDAAEGRPLQTGAICDARAAIKLARANLVEASEHVHEIAEAEVGAVDAFAHLSEHAVVFEPEVAKAFGKCRMTIKRCVQRGELPHPFRMMGKNAWTAGALRAHFTKLSGNALKEQKRVRELVER